MSLPKFTFQLAFGRERIGSYILCFTFQYTYPRSNSNIPRIITDLSGIVSVSREGQSNHIELGEIKVYNSPQYIEEGVSPNSITLFTELNSHTLERLEALRAGRGLTFTFGMNAAFRLGERIYTEFLSSTVPQTTINQSSWCKIKEQMGMYETLLLEVPMPDASKHPEFSLPLNELQKALTNVSDYEPHQVAYLCRRTLEILNDSFTDEDVSGTGTSFLKKIMDEPELTKGDIKDWTKEKRLCALRKSILIVLHGAVHLDAKTKGFTWTVSDAKLLVGLTTLLMNWYTGQKGELIIPED